MWIDETSNENEYFLWKQRKNAFGGSFLPQFRREPNATLWICLIYQKRRARAKTFFEGDEAVVIGIGPSEVDGGSANAFGVFDGFPQQERHATEIVKAGIAATVFVNDSIFVTECENGGNRFFIFAGNANKRAIAQTAQDIFKPCKRRRRKRLTTPGEHGESVKSAKKTF